MSCWTFGPSGSLQLLNALASLCALGHNQGLVHLLAASRPPRASHLAEATAATPALAACTMQSHTYTTSLANFDASASPVMRQLVACSKRKSCFAPLERTGFAVQAAAQHRKLWQPDCWPAAVAGEQGLKQLARGIMGSSRLSWGIEQPVSPSSLAGSSLLSLPWAVEAAGPIKASLPSTSQAAHPEKAGTGKPAATAPSSIVLLQAASANSSAAGSNASADGTAGASPARPPDDDLEHHGRPSGGDNDDAEARKREFMLNYGHAVIILREDLPELLEREQRFDIYREDVVFRTPSQHSFSGLTKYRLLLRGLRLAARVAWRSPSVAIRRMWQPEEHVLRVRWTISGTPRLPWAADQAVVEAISTFTFDSRGLIREHAVDQMLPPETPLLEWLAALVMLLRGARPTDLPMPMPVPGVPGGMQRQWAAKGPREQQGNAFG